MLEGIPALPFWLGELFLRVTVLLGYLPSCAVSRFFKLRVAGGTDKTVTKENQRAVVINYRVTVGSFTERTTWLMEWWAPPFFSLVNRPTDGPQDQNVAARPQPNRPGVV